MSFNTTTENRDAAFSTSGNCCLDFFTRITRNAPVSDYIEAFTKAWAENRETAYQVLMNMRDVRGGKGEKLIPAVIMVYLKLNIEQNVYEAMLHKMIEYGYWKDLLKIIEIECRTKMEINCKTMDKCPIEVQLFAKQLQQDAIALETTTEKKAIISLCAKWAPSEKTHYDHHPMQIAKNIMAAMNLQPKEYRQLLTKLRKHLNVLEMLMSTQQYDLIDFSKVPSVAMMKLKKAFNRDVNSSGIESEGRKKLNLSYKDFLKKLATGKTKVNVKGIQPHELVSSYFNGEPLDPLVEGQWIELKKRVKETGVFRNVTAVVDVSGSMHGQPMEVSVALGILVAECTTGPFHGKVITFHEQPSWHHLVGSNLREQVRCMKNTPWGGSTNLRAVFDIILKDAVNAQLTQEEMVKTLFIFTDMQFNSACHSHESTFSYAKAAFNKAGYQLPRIVCWNLRTSNSKSLPVQQNEEGYAMLSGFSAELLKCVLTTEEFTPYSMMMHVLEPYTVPLEINKCIINSMVPPFGNIVHLGTAVEKSAIKKAFKGSDAATKIESRQVSDETSDSKSESESDSDSDDFNSVPICTEPLNLTSWGQLPEDSDSD